MNDTDLLLMEMTEGTLTAEQEARLAALCKADPKLESRRQSLLKTVSAAAALPRIDAKPGFEERLLASLAKPRLVAERAPSMWQRWVSAITAPMRISPFAIGGSAFVGAAAAALVILAVVPRGTPRPAPAPARTAAPMLDVRATSHETIAALPAAQEITFALTAPRAKKVSLAGDFNDWRVDDLNLAHGPSGMWSIQIPVAPGRHRYMFVVDGKVWVTDPNAADFEDDGLGNKDAVLEL